MACFRQYILSSSSSVSPSSPVIFTRTNDKYKLALQMSHSNSSNEAVFFFDSIFSVLLTPWSWRRKSKRNMLKIISIDPYLTFDILPLWFGAAVSPSRRYRLSLALFAPEYRDYCADRLQLRTLIALRRTWLVRNFLGCPEKKGYIQKLDIYIFCNVIACCCNMQLSIANCCRKNTNIYNSSLQNFKILLADDQFLVESCDDSKNEVQFFKYLEQFFEI